MRHQKCGEAGLLAADSIMFRLLLTLYPFRWAALQMRKWQKNRFRIGIDSNNHAAKQCAKQQDRRRQSKCADMLLEGRREFIPKQPDESTSAPALASFVD